MKTVNVICILFAVTWFIWWELAATSRLAWSTQVRL